MTVQEENSKLNKQIFNNYVVGLRNTVTKAVDHTVSKLVREAARIRNRKTVDPKLKAKNDRRADRYIEEIKALKSFHLDDISKFAIMNTTSQQVIGSNPESSVEERALAHISDHKLIKDAVLKFRESFPNWADEVPNIIKVLGVIYRKKRIARWAAKGKLTKLMEREQKVFLILQKLCGMELDPKLLKFATHDIPSKVKTETENNDTVSPTQKTQAEIDNLKNMKMQMKEKSYDYKKRGKLKKLNSDGNSEHESLDTDAKEYVKAEAMADHEYVEKIYERKGNTDISNDDELETAEMSSESDRREDKRKAVDDGINDNSHDKMGKKRKKETCKTAENFSNKKLKKNKINKNNTDNAVTLTSVFSNFEEVSLHHETKTNHHTKENCRKIRALSGTQLPVGEKKPCNTHKYISTEVNKPSHDKNVFTSDSHNSNFLPKRLESKPVINIFSKGTSEVHQINLTQAKNLGMTEVKEDIISNKETASQESDSDSADECKIKGNKTSFFLGRSYDDEYSHSRREDVELQNSEIEDKNLGVDSSKYFKRNIFRIKDDIPQKRKYEILDDRRDQKRFRTGSESFNFKHRQEFNTGGRMNGRGKKKFSRDNRGLGKGAFKQSREGIDRDRVGFRSGRDSFTNERDNFRMAGSKFSRGGKNFSNSRDGISKGSSEERGVFKKGQGALGSDSEKRGQKLLPYKRSDRTSKTERLSNFKGGKARDCVLHPSWVAKKQQNTSITTFQGKRLTFDE